MIWKKYERKSFQLNSKDAQKAKYIAIQQTKMNVTGWSRWKPYSRIYEEKLVKKNKKWHKMFVHIRDKGRMYKNDEDEEFQKILIIIIVKEMKEVDCR